MKKITFSHSYGHGEYNKVKETVEFDDDVTQKVIQEEFEAWVWERIGDTVGWYEEG